MQCFLIRLFVCCLLQNAMLANSQVLDTGTYALLGELNTVAREMDNLTVTVKNFNASGSTAFLCAFCTTIGNRIASASKQVKSQADSTFNSMNSRRSFALSSSCFVCIFRFVFVVCLCVGVLQAR